MHEHPQKWGNARALPFHPSANIASRYANRFSGISSIGISTFITPGSGKLRMNVLNCLENDFFGMIKTPPLYRQQTTQQGQ